MSQKSSKNPLLGFKVINVDTSKKPVTSACYDMHYATCLYLSATFFTLYEPIAAK